MANKLEKLMINRADLVDKPSNPLARVMLYKRKLDSKDRKDMKDSEFAYVAPDGTKHLPINDANHVRNALARLDQTDIPAGAKATARKKIMAAAKRFGIDVSKTAMTTNDVIDTQVFWQTYGQYLDAFRMSVDSIMCDYDEGIDKSEMLQDSVLEFADNLHTLFDKLPMAKHEETETNEIFNKVEKTVDVLNEIDTLILTQKFTADEVFELLEGLGMATNTEDIKKLQAEIEVLKADLAKAKKDAENKEKELKDEKEKKAKDKKDDGDEDDDYKKSEKVDIWKGVHPQIRAEFEALQKSAAAAEEIAKAAQENAEMVKLTKRVGDELPTIQGTQVEKTTMLREIQKAVKTEQFEKLFAVLKAANAVIAKSSLLDEKGHNGNAGGGGSAIEKMKALAAEKIAKGEAKTEAEAIIKAAKDNKELYKEYLAEGN